MPLEVEIVDFDNGYIHVVVSDERAWIEVMAIVDIPSPRTLVLRSMDVHGPGANRVGIRWLRSVARALKEELGVDELRIEGGTRTTGANPGRTPRPRRI
ncbi:MAG TPA: hypothetical protein VJY39_23150 [Acidisphaera sp.]|nr:hypothetical protein [Acidisphaera sp.]